MFQQSIKITIKKENELSIYLVLIYKRINLNKIERYQETKTQRSPMTYVAIKLKHEVVPQPIICSCTAEP